MSNAIYVNFQDFEGECKESGHEGWCEVESINHSLEANVDRTAGTAGENLMIGKTQHHDVVIKKKLDKASGPLLEACCNGHSFPEITFDFIINFGEAKNLVYQLKLREVVVAKFSYGDGESNQGRPTEEISLCYREIQWIYNLYKDSGESDGLGFDKSWNLKTNEPA